MKELSIEEKANHYDELLVKAKQIYNKENDVLIIHTVEDLFPELKESEDERIRQFLIHEVTETSDEIMSYRNMNKKDVLAWLEKQGEHANFRNKIQIGDKVTRNKDGVLVNLSQLNRVAKKDEKQGEQKPTIIIPRFRVGDEIKTTNEAPLTITKITDSGYWSEDLFICSFENSTKWELVEQKPTDNIEPKFKVGDFIVNDYCMGKVIELTNDAYLLDTGQGIPFSCEHNAHLWTIQDAKDGDILVCGKDKRPFIFKGLLDKFHPNNPVAYCGIDCGNEFFIPIGAIWWTDEEVEPATKEQTTLFFQKMKEAGYEWNAEKKELKKIEPKTTEDADLPEFESYLCLMFQKFRTKGMCTNGEIIDYVKEHSQKLRNILVRPSWSEEDDKILKSIIINIENLQFSEDMREKYHHIPNANKSYYQIMIDWLKSLKDRVQPNQEWSEEDEEMYKEVLTDIIYAKNDLKLKECLGLSKRAMKAFNWFSKRYKSLKPQNWTKEDKERYISCLQRLGTGNSEQPETINSKWFKEHVYPQSTWKPSNEQITWLYRAADDARKDSRMKHVLNELLSDLKKLREE